MDALVQAAVDHWTWTLIAAVVIFAIGAATAESMLKNASRMRLRRELAAYIAEGSISPEQADRIAKGGMFAAEDDPAARSVDERIHVAVAPLVAKGAVSSEDVERIVDAARACRTPRVGVVCRVGKC